MRSSSSASATPTTTTTGSRASSSSCARSRSRSRRSFDVHEAARSSSTRSRTTSRSAEGGLQAAGQRRCSRTRSSRRTCRAGTSSRRRSRASTGYSVHVRAARRDPEGRAASSRTRTSTSRRPRTPPRSAASVKPKTPAAAEDDGHRPERQRRSRLRGERARTCSRSAATSRCCRRATRRPNAPTRTTSTRRSTSTRREGREGGRAAALQKLARSRRTCSRCRRTPALRALDPGAMLALRHSARPSTTTLGTIADRRGAEAAAADRPLRPGGRDGSCSSRTGPRAVPADGADGARAHLVPRHATTATCPSRLYRIQRQDHKAVRLVFRTGASEYWGIQETDWNDAPVLADRSFRHELKGREYDLYYSGSHLHMVVLAGARRDATGSSTRCSTRSRTRRCSRSRRASSR